MSILEVKGVAKRFGGLQALSDVNLSVRENSVHAIIGCKSGRSRGMRVANSGKLRFKSEP